MARKYYAFGGVVSPATPTDFAIINGDNNRLVRVTKVLFSSLQTTAGQNLFFVAKRSTANTGGTSSVLSAVPADSQSIPAAAVVQRYTANPTTGNLVGFIWRAYSSTPAVASVVDNRPLIVDFGDGIPLRNASEGLALHFGGAALPAGFTLAVGFEWTEE